jgi:hypothetical protein
MSFFYPRRQKPLAHWHNRKDFFTIGNFRHAPNVDGVKVRERNRGEEGRGRERKGEEGRGRERKGGKSGKKERE